MGRKQRSAWYRRGAGGLTNLCLPLLKEEYLVQIQLAPSCCVAFGTSLELSEPQPVCCF